MYRSISNVLRSEIVTESLKKTRHINTRRSLSVASTLAYTRRKQLIPQSTSILNATNKLKWNCNYNIVRFYADLPSHQKVTLPALSPTMESGTIVSWEKKEGDKLNEGDLLAEIETDKATMGFETPEEGYLAKILVPAGTKNVPIGKLVCIIVSNEADVAAFKDFKDDSSAAPSKPKPAAPAPAAAAPPSPAGAPPSPALSSTSSGERVYASPMAKRLAEQRQIRLQGKGTGLYDSITSRDLPAAGAAPAPSLGPAPTIKPQVPSTPGAAFIDIPVSNMRAVIAKRLVESKQFIPHYYLTVNIQIDKILKTRARFNKALEKEGIKISVNDFIIKAMALSCKRVPEANSSWMTSFIRQYNNVDVSVAVSTDKGLITPIVFRADYKGLIEISKNVKEIAAKARSGKLQPAEFQGGTITVSNLGMFGVDEFAAVINPPQACILAVGTGRKQLVLDEKSEKGFKEVQMMSVTLSCDHRVVDGALGAKWLEVFRKFMEDPESMIL